MERPSLQSIPADIAASIQQSLDEVERAHDVRILFAIESGSRAWGFPSPDSDYDVRFVYAHRPDWYLSVRPQRDVIELPLDKIYDINGWDIRKALWLACRSNPVLGEWAVSPIVYRHDPAEHAKVAEFIAVGSNRDTLRHHYASLASSAFRRDIGDTDRPPLKKYFYSLRPALMLRWLRLNESGTPPMDLPSLLSQSAMEPEQREEIEMLVALKLQTRELGNGPRRSALDALITHEIEAANRFLLDKTVRDAKQAEDRIRQQHPELKPASHEPLRIVKSTLSFGSGELPPDLQRLMQQEIKAVRAMQTPEPARENEANGLLRDILASIWLS